MPQVTTTDADAGWVQRYLEVLGVERAAPSRAALAALTRAHVNAIAFENVTSLLRRAAHPVGPVPALDHEALLRNWEAGRGGGVCFEVAGMFGRLLENLGYNVVGILAQISFPGSHHALMVDLGGERVLVDAGNGAPFFEPIPLDWTVEVHHAGLAYRFRRGEAEETWVQDRWIKNAWDPFCRYDLRRPTDDERDAAYQRHHEIGESWVVGDLRLIRCEQGEVFRFGEGEFTHYTAGGKRTKPVSDDVEIARLTAQVFRLPALPLADAVRARAELAAATVTNTSFNR
jgi:N-hydroxyarylamine O-acetyltransferase